MNEEPLLEALSDCIDALWIAEEYLVQRGIETKGTVGRTQVLPRIRAALKNAAHVYAARCPYATHTGNAWDGVCAFRFVAEQRGDEDSDPPRCPQDVREKCADETCPWRHNAGIHPADTRCIIELRREVLCRLARTILSATEPQSGATP
jgi:hypothetical protein